MKTGVFWSAAVLAADRLTKQWAVRALAVGSIEWIPGVLAFTYAENTGMAFSLFSGHPRLLAVVSLALIALVLFFLRRSMRRTRLTDALQGVILGGGLGNAIDRLLYGYVIDFIEPRFMRFAIFNVADIAVTIGALALVAVSCLEHTEEEHERAGRDERD